MREILIIYDMKITSMVVHLPIPGFFPKWFLVEPPKDASSRVDEAWNSSSEDSLRVYFPRHSLRV